jgi:MinD-like ATPase involved in chromosome partitioning or flagellar assembly
MPDREGEIVTFYSYKGGTGRTMALASIAWILASHGKSVLVVDWDLEAPGLHRYFHPFLLDKDLRNTSGVMDMVWDYTFAAMNGETSDDTDWHVPYADVLRHAVSLRWDFPEQGNIDLLSAGRQNASFAQRVSSFDWHRFYERFGGGTFIDAMKAGMRREYDYVLVDSRTGLSDTAGLCTVQLPDTLVACFTMSSQSIAGCASVAGSVRRQRNDIHILPVPMRVESGESDRLEESRDYARWWFRRALDGAPPVKSAEYWGEVEIPYRSLYAYEEMIAPIGDRALQGDTVLAACERITFHLTGGRVNGYVSTGEAERRELRQRYRQRPDRQAGYDIVIVDALSSTAWSAWIGAELEDAGFSVDRAEGTPAVLRALGDHTDVTARARIVLVIIPAVFEQQTASADRPLARILEQPDPAGRIIPVRVTAAQLPRAIATNETLELSGLEEEEARKRLIDRVTDLLGEPVGSGHRAGPRSASSAVRYPYAMPAVWEVPRRLVPFVGREQELQRLRNKLGTTAKTVVVHGMPGVGKTALAVEYAHRNRGDYEAVLYVRAPDGVRTGDQALRFAEPAGEPGVGEAEVPAGPPRTLMIVDDVLGDLSGPDRVPDNHHVLLLSRERPRVPALPVVRLSVLPADDAIDLLRRHVPAMSAEDADMVSTRLGHLPLALRIAANHLSVDGASMRDYLVLLDNRFDEVVLRAGGDAGRTLAQSVRHLYQDISESSAAAAQLLAVLSLVAPCPVPRQILLASPEVFTGPLRTALRDPKGLARVGGTLADHSLVETAAGEFSVHPVLGAAVRASLSDTRRIELARQVAEMLTANDPGDPALPEHWAVYRLLMPLVAAVPWPMKATFRELVLRLCWFQLTTGNPLTAKDLSDRAVHSFELGYGPMHEDTLAALHIKAMCSWGLEDYDDATTTLTRLIAARRQLLGGEHEATLASQSNLAAVLAAQGQWDLAYELHAVVLGVRIRTLGTDHLDTVISRGNLASCHFGLEQYEEAFAIEDDVLQQMRKLIGVRHPATVSSAENLALTARKLGRTADAERLLTSAWNTRRETMGNQHPTSLRCGAELAELWVGMGRTAEASELAHLILDDLRKVLGTENQLTLRVARLSGEDTGTPEQETGSESWNR